MSMNRRDFLKGTAWMGAAAMAAGCANSLKFCGNGGMMQGFANPAPAPDVSTEVSTLNSDGTWDCKCGTKGLTGKFCSECGYPRPTA